MINSTQITDTENTVNKLRYILITNLSNKITRIEKPSEIDICKDNLNVSSFSGHGEIISSVTPHTLLIPHNNKSKRTPDTLIIINQLIK